MLQIPPQAEQLPQREGGCRHRAQIRQHLRIRHHIRHIRNQPKHLRHIRLQIRPEVHLPRLHPFDSGARQAESGGFLQAKHIARRQGLHNQNHNPKSRRRAARGHRNIRLGNHRQKRTQHQDRGTREGRHGAQPNTPQAPRGNQQQKPPHQDNWPRPQKPLQRNDWVQRDIEGGPRTAKLRGGSRIRRNHQAGGVGGLRITCQPIGLLHIAIGRYANCEKRV